MSPATRHLYLARHGHASADETRLTAAGRGQAVLLVEQLAGVPVRTSNDLAHLPVELRWTGFAAELQV